MISWRLSQLGNSDLDNLVLMIRLRYDLATWKEILQKYSLEKSWDYISTIAWFKLNPSTYRLSGQHWFWLRSIEGKNVHSMGRNVHSMKVKKTASHKIECWSCWIRWYSLSRWTEEAMINSTITGLARLMIDGKLCKD